MVKIYFLFFTLSAFGNLFSQVSGCFEIQSILVDACGTPEGENEMVRFEVGSNSLNTNDLVATWSNNTFQGICQNGTTQNTVAYMNSTIQSCGYFLEPDAGLLPANSKVLFITSSDFDATSHSYAGLEDTIHVIFQCAGNTQGHFANWTNGCDPSTGDRTTTIDFGNGCSQTVTYNKCDLLNQSGGVGGSSANRDGARVDFDSNGDPSYANEGCVIPFSSVDVEAELLLNDGELCPGETINLTGDVINSSYFQWTSSNGTFLDSEILMTEYTDNSSSAGSYYIYLSAENGCNEGISDSILITVLDSPNVSLDSTILSMDSCNINEVLLEASGANQYEWSNGESGASIVVSSSGEYIVVGENECGSDQAEMYVDLDIDCEDTLPDPEEEFLEDFTIKIPNVFTPNKDGSNDYFGVWTNLEVEIEYVLLNRWGNVMKEGVIQSSSANFNEFWNGQVRGQKAGDGTYFYKINVTINQSNQKEYQGYFQLVR
ncbi:MAG: gliding motility-associated C-terminal domain-containing protein [Brumimicrobium sp.]